MSLPARALAGKVLAAKGLIFPSKRGTGAPKNVAKTRSYRMLPPLGDGFMLTLQGG